MYPTAARVLVSIDRKETSNMYHEQVSASNFPQEISVNFTEETGEYKVEDTYVGYKAKLRTKPNVDILEGDIINDQYVVLRVVKQYGVSGRIQQLLVFLG